MNVPKYRFFKLFDNNIIIYELILYPAIHKTIYYFDLSSIYNSANIDH